jgi:hypothetical protein
MKRNQTVKSNMKIQSIYLIQENEEAVDEIDNKTKIDNIVRRLSIRKTSVKSKAK